MPTARFANETQSARKKASLFETPQFIYGVSLLRSALSIAAFSSSCFLTLLAKVLQKHKQKCYN